MKKKKQKKNNDMSFLPTELLTEFIPAVNSLVNCKHCPLCQLQRESPIKNSVGIFKRAPELFTFQLHY